MEITCKNCKTTLNIPDEKIGKGQRAVFNCPECENKLVLEIPKPKEKPPVPEPAPKTEPSGTEAADRHNKPQESDSILGFYEEGAKLALVLENDPSEAEMMKQVIKELGYSYVSAENNAEAIKKMRFNHFDLVILSDLFGGIELGQSPIIRNLNYLPMAIRRKMFLALIGDKLKTMNPSMAFVMNADLVVNRRDTDKLSIILKKAISDNEEFYSVFMEVFEEVGRD
ncbi:MAG: hypothetical protein GY864_12270 [Desulfobacterales bacterium]|nr:hypothetical protein [Desulfobacterales bacterium]